MTTGNDNVATVWLADCKRFEHIYQLSQTIWANDVILLANFIHTALLSSNLNSFIYRNIDCITFKNVIMNVITTDNSINKCNFPIVLQLWINWWL